MIIDLILDRKDGRDYNVKKFYNDVTKYGSIGIDIASALDGGTNEDVQKALCTYIKNNDYNADICTYIESVDWLQPCPDCGSAMDTEWNCCSNDKCDYFA